MKKFQVITLCGSTKYKKEFYEAAKQLKCEGNIVLMPHIFSHYDNEKIDNSFKLMLVRMHNQMIEMSDGIFVINVDGYMGESTRSEIRYAEKIGKRVNYLIE